MSDTLKPSEAPTPAQERGRLLQIEQNQKTIEPRGYRPTRSGWFMRVSLEHDPEKWKAVFRKDHVPLKI